MLPQKNRIPFSQKSQDDKFKNCDQEIYDICIVGGGINGAGSAFESLRSGCKTLLVEKSDFASGTSSKSSRLVHGGLRYLEQFEFKLVFEALKERTYLLKKIPHLVKPIEFVLPLYKGDRVSAFKLRAGLFLYDLFCGFRAPHFHQRVSVSKLFQFFPKLKRRNSLGGFLYSDAMMEDDRIVVDLARRSHELGGDIFSYTEVLEAEQKNDVLEVTLKRGSEIKKIKTQHLISALGPWTDIFMSQLDSTWVPRLKPTKGVHVFFKTQAFQMKKALVMGADNQKRILFVIPRNEGILVGTTDTHFSDSPDSVKSEAADVDYILKVLKDYFPDIDLSSPSWVSTYAGVRPLVSDGASSESKISRNHVIESHLNNQVTVIMGGKYTTYRVMCQEAVSKALKNMGLSSKEKISDTFTPHFGEFDNSVIPSDHPVLSQSDLKQLFQRRGDEAHTILTEFKGQGLWEYEAQFAIEYEAVKSLKDFYLRRTPLFDQQHLCDQASIENMGRLFQSKLGWSDNQLQAEVESLMAAVQEQKEILSV